ncbi:feruloyl esterase [Apiospora aurea]|uniref:Carboxylic ester hydrolase n=1 Tax=Apiospora aurea TaxID=335848 RepID=A0ABR1QPG4_9PEZI
MDQLASFLGFGSVTTGPVGLSSCAAASIPCPTSLPSAEFLSVEGHVVTNYTVTIPPGFKNSFAAPYSPLPILNFCNVTLIYSTRAWATTSGPKCGFPWAIWTASVTVVTGSVIRRRRRRPTAAVPRRPLLERPPPSRRRRRPLHRLHPPNPASRPRRRLRRRDHRRRAPGGADQGDAASALASKGNVDWAAVQNFASIASIGTRRRRHRPGRDRGLLRGESTVRVLYRLLDGRAPGRGAGAALAGDYDGYLAGAASVRCQDVTAALGPQTRMVELGYAPPACEMRELRRLAVQKCNGLDGVEDGLVSEPERCFGAFDPRAHVGDEFVCEETGRKLKITKEGGEIATLAWEGLREGDDVVWGGVGHQADLAGSRFSWVATACDYHNGTSSPECKPKPWSFATAWVQYFLLQDPATPSGPTAFFKSGLRDIERLVYLGRQWYTSILSAFDTDLSALRDGGGKLLMWHGMADEAVPLNNSRAYYDAVAAQDPDRIDEYLRYFEAPGLSHCGIGGNGNGLFPMRLLDVLRA